MPSYKDININDIFGSYIVVTPPYKEGKVYKVKLQCTCGTERIAATSDLHKFTTRKCKVCWANSLRSYTVGSRNGMLKILDVHTEFHKATRVTVECDCGNVYTCLGSTFKTTKCCALCSKAKRGPDHPSYKGYKNVSAVYFSQIKLGAMKRKLEFTVTIEELADLYDRQGGKCAITNMPIILDTSKRRTELHHKNTASLDRIDSKLGYVTGNVQWVHKDINFMKQQFSMTYFLTLCKAVVNASI